MHVIVVKVNKKLKISSAELHPIPVKAQIWCQVGMDLIGPLTESPRGNKYIITLTDYFSKWAEATVLRYFLIELQMM